MYSEFAEGVLNKALCDYRKRANLKRDRPVITETKQSRIPTINRGVKEYFLALLV